MGSNPIPRIKGPLTRGLKPDKQNLSAPFKWCLKAIRRSGRIQALNAVKTISHIQYIYGNRPVKPSIRATPLRASDAEQHTTFSPEKRCGIRIRGPQHHTTRNMKREKKKKRKGNQIAYLFFLAAFFFAAIVCHLIAEARVCRPNDDCFMPSLAFKYINISILSVKCC